MERNYDDYFKVFFKACTSVHVRKKRVRPRRNEIILIYLLILPQADKKGYYFQFAWVSAPSGVIACTTTSVGETDANKYGYNNFQSTAVTIDNCCATSASSSSRGNSVGSGDDDNYFRISFIVTCPGQRCV